LRFEAQKAFAARIRSWAREEGFVACKITRPWLGLREGARLLGWTHRGMQAEMGWMAEASRLRHRLDPARFGHGAKSAIVLAWPYAPPPYALDEALRQRSRGVIASYAFGRDYHDPIRKALLRLGRRIEAELGARFRVHVDTSPVVEASLAAQAGLGWIGRHSLILSRELGSWFFLAGLLVSVPLPADVPARFHCGSCRRCIDLCPTKAIVADGVVDARRCLSYWTIEHKGFLPHAIRVALGNRIYGCDDCQLVCPWNRKARSVAWQDDPLQVQRDRVLPQLAEMLALDEAGFRVRFAKSAIRRIGYARFLRNCAVAAGNSGDAALWPLLERLLTHPEALVRAHAAWGLARLGALLGPAHAIQAERLLVCVAAEEDDARARADIVQTLQALQHGLLAKPDDLR